MTTTDTPDGARNPHGPMRRDTLRRLARLVASTPDDTSVEAYAGEALETTLNHGTPLDYDTMTAIHDIMGANLGWRFYAYADGRYDDDLLELCGHPDEARKFLNDALRDMLDEPDAAVIETADGETTVTADPWRDQETMGPADDEPVTGLRITLDNIAAVHVKKDIERRSNDGRPYTLLHVRRIISRLMRALADDRHSWYLPLAISALAKRDGRQWTIDDIDTLLNDLEAERVTPLGTDPEDTADRINAILQETGARADAIRILPTHDREWPLIAIRQ